MLSASSDKNDWKQCDGKLAQCTIKRTAFSSSQSIIIENSFQNLEDNQLVGFIRNRFGHAFAAEIHSFMPFLLGWQERQNIQAALGVRINNQPLFIEQYLPCKIDEFLISQDICTSRTKVAEIGHFCSVSRRYSLPLMIFAITGLYLTGVEYVVFTANEQLRKTLNSYQIAGIPLVEANASSLALSEDNWGSYYQHSPVVTALKIAPVMQKIINDKNYTVTLDQFCFPLERFLKMVGGKQ